ncbi:MAG: acetyltransferase [Deltaproteobacteria bacterium]|nr:acetyltransferase [Deltaproteobacteria bacterium]
MRVTVDVVGAGGHAKVVLALLHSCGWPVGVVVDGSADRQGSTLLGHTIEREDALALGADRRVVVAIGNNAARRRVADRLLAAGHRFATLVHPTAWVAPSARLGDGAVVFAGAIVQPDVVVGAHAILNTGCSVDHDCVVGAFSHVAPGARLCGAVQVGDGALVGVGAAVIPAVRIGAWATVGAGAAVVRDVDAGATVVGVPARPTSTSPGRSGT